MLAAIDSPKSKSITIAFMALKAMVMGFVVMKSNQSLSSVSCMTDMGSMISLLQIFFLISCVFDAFLLLYFYCTDTFSRLQYYIFFVFHIIFTFFTIGALLDKIQYSGQCSLKDEIIGMSLFVNVIFLLSSLLIMWSTLYFGLRFAHLGSNIVWTFIWFSGTKCTNIPLYAIAIIHGSLSLIGLISFIMITAIGKKKITATCWRYLYVASIILMIACYILSFFAELPQNQQCLTARVFALAYQRYGLIQLISPILLLIYMNTQMGDPREQILVKDAKIFLSTRENKNFITDDSI